MRDDQATGDLQGGQVEAEETHDERAADSEHCEDRKDIDAGLPRLGAHRRRVVGGGQAREGGESSDRLVIGASARSSLRFLREWSSYPQS